MATISKAKVRIKLLPSSSQALNAICYTLIITVALFFLNVYIARNSRQMLFRAQYLAMQEKAQLISSSMSGVEMLTTDSVAQVVNLLGEDIATRLIVTDEAGRCLYDNVPDGLPAGSLVMLPEIYNALSGKDVFHCTYSNGATSSFCAVAVMYYDIPVGAVYLMDYEQEQSAVIAQTESNVFKISVVLEVVVVVFAALFSLIFSRRMQTILQSFPRIRAGDYGYKIKLGGNDELTELATEFNKMTDKLVDEIAPEVFSLWRKGGLKTIDDISEEIALRTRQMLESGAALPPQTESFVRALTNRDSLALVQTLAPMEKWKRDALMEILQSWLELAEMALAARTGGAAASALARVLAEGRSSAELLSLTRHLRKALEYARSNVSPAAICGYLSWALRGSYD